MREARLPYAFVSSALVFVLFAALATPSGAAPSSGLVTTWIGGLGDWGAAKNWSAGVPTSGHVARIASVGTVVVTQMGETCQRLDIAIGGIPTLRVSGGSLAVTDTLHLGIDDLGTVQHMSGTVTANTLVIGGVPPGGGAYAMTNGTLTVGSAWIGTSEVFASGQLTMAQTSTCTITGSLHVASAGSIGIGGTATLTAGTGAADEVTLDGSFGITGTPAVTFTRFTMAPTATLNATIVLGDHAPIVVTGPAVIDGTLLVTDVQTPDGEYEILRGNPLSGSFDSAIFTSPGWSWRVSGNSLYVDRSTSPVESVSWGGIKGRFLGDRGTSIVAPF